MNLASHERNVDKFSTVATVTATVTVTVKQCMTSVGLNCCRQMLYQLS